MARRSDIAARLRLLGATKDFAVEPFSVAGYVRLIDLQLGHAIQNGRLAAPVFGRLEAIEFLKGVRRDEA